MDELLTQALVHFLWTSVAFGGRTSILEVLVILVTASGLSFSAWGIRESRRDLSALRAQHLNGRRRIVALGTMRREMVRAAELALFLFCGILAGANAPPSGGPTTAGIVITLALVLVSLLLMLNTALDQADRSALNRYGAEPDPLPIQQDYDLLP